jgi:hypothetical protein
MSHAAIVPSARKPRASADPRIHACTERACTADAATSSTDPSITTEEADDMTSYAANPSITRSDRRSRPATQLRVRRFAVIATAVVIEAMLILVVVLSTVGAGSTPPGPGQPMPAPAALPR